MSKTLTDLQQRVFDVLSERMNTDVKIAVIYDAAYPTDSSTIRTPREMQQRLGPLLSRINSKLKRGRIEPGEMKRTYRLNTNKSA